MKPKQCSSPKLTSTHGGTFDGYRWLIISILIHPSHPYSCNIIVIAQYISTKPKLTNTQHRTMKFTLLLITAAFAANAVQAQGALRATESRQLEVSYIISPTLHYTCAK